MARLLPRGQTGIIAVPAERVSRSAEEIVQAFDVLQSSPLIGRPADGGKRELVISAGARGHIAVYRYAADMGTAFVLAVYSRLEKRPLA